MKKIAVFVPLLVISGLYACATGTTDIGDGEPEVATPRDSGSDATTTRSDGGSAAPAKDGGTSSSGDAGRDGGGSSSGGSSSSSSSSGGGGAAACDSTLNVFVGGLILASEGSLPPGVTEIDSCDECNAAEPGCCATFSIVPQGTYCYDPLGGAPLPDGGL